MIQLKRLNNMEFVLNPELIEQIESTPDTVITMVTGNNIVVKNSMDDVIDKIMEYRKTVSGNLRNPIGSLVRQKV